MLKGIAKALFGTRHDRELKRVQPILDEIHQHEQRLASLADDEVQAQTPKFRAVLKERTEELERRIAELKETKRVTSEAAEREQIDNELTGPDGLGGLEGDLRDLIADTLEELLPEAFATVREAARRLLTTKLTVTGHEIDWNMVPYDVQLIGGVQLHRGRIAEMATGEGKTLVATLPLYLNALPGKGAHLVTVNSYLARRDSQWMGHVYRWLGLTVGCIDDTEPGTVDRRAGYLCDITYGTNNEFGFDYLRDNMVVALEQRVQRRHHYAIVDEVDSVLIDEARTPLIISGPVGNESDRDYAQYNGMVSRLAREQTELVNRLVGEAERALEKGDTDAAATSLYQANLGAPKNKRLLKVLQEQGNRQLMQKRELDVIADRKIPASKRQFVDVEEELLYVIDEKGHTVHLTDRGVDVLSPSDHDAFVLPDISEAVHRIDHDAEMLPQEKVEARLAVERDYALKDRKSVV